MDIQFLEKNPFFVLDVLPTDKRTAIVGKAEEKAFFLDSNICNEAQTSFPERKQWRKVICSFMHAL